ncbi:FAD/NAD(P)-binding protein [Curtobacterium sp. USHLN213]|uniref:FAD/NAD(P)-binding protein n=1 Tax=Curtobacterium sp. USHLN213 TaxID=3081255 RepID=UPI00301A25BA
MNAIAIVGAGPRGLSVLERVAALATSGKAPTAIHLIDPHGPGGRVWRADQPTELLMNTTAGAATLYLDDTVTIPDEPRIGPTLYEWALALRAAGGADPELLTEIGSLTPFTSVSRRLYGTYIRSVFDDVIASLPEHVRVVVHRARASSISRLPDGERLRLSTGDVLDVDAAVIALGHIDTADSAQVARARAASTAGGWTFVGPGHPAEQPLDALQPGEAVVVRGLGLNFFDLMALLTVERGGVFEETDGVRLTYRPSGREPVLWVGARRGLPFKAKPTLVAGALPPQVRRYPSDETITALAARAGSVSFDDDVWPWVRKDALWQAAATELRYDRPDLVDDLASLFDAHPDSSVPDPQVLRDHFPGHDFTYDPDRSGDALAGMIFADGHALDQHVLEWIESDLADAENAAVSPVKEGDRAIGASRYWIFPLAEYGGLDGASHVRRFAGWFEGYANALAGGPPALRLRQLAALVRAGVVHMLGAGLQVEVEESGVRATSASVPSVRIEARALVEARLPDGDVRRASDPLVRDLLATGRIRPYTAPTQDGQGVVFPGLDVGDAPYSVLDRDAVADPRLFAIGVPVGPHVGTSLTGYARANAGFFRQTDSVARALLAASGKEPYEPAR